MNYPYKIAYTGTHGTGKTTSVLEKARDLKILHSDKKVSIIMENAADCPLPINKEGSEQTQLWMFSSMMSREIEMSTKYDIVVCDRTVCDSIAYSISNGFEDLAEAQLRVAAKHVESYDAIIFKTIENNNWWFKDGLRDINDSDWRFSVEKILRGIYDRLIDEFDCKLNITVI